MKNNVEKKGTDQIYENRVISDLNLKILISKPKR